MSIISFAPDVRSLLAKRGAYSGTDCTMINKKSDAYKKWMREYRQSDKYRAYMKEYMSKYRKQEGDATKKRVARSELTKALLRGDIKRNPCVVCNNDKSQGHHPDYDKPLEVIWLCRRHHQEVHSGQLSLTKISMKTLEQYMRQNLEKEIIDHSIRVHEERGQVTFYIHPTGKDGDTLDFVVSSNQLSPDTKGID